jgi:predicted nucleotidyltransferase
MNIVGIIAEYNPFHNGHLLHIQQAKKICRADHVICVMSGHFLQRGEPALFDKWSRAAMAVAGGADLVFELPTVFACRSAGMFARGGVQALAATNLTTHLCFGSEAGSLEPLSGIAAILAQEPHLYQEVLQKYLQQGLSYPAARSHAVQAYHADTNISPCATVAKIMTAPNNNLAIEYLTSLRNLNSPIQPVTIKRQQAQYHDQTIHGTIASATAIRKNLQQNGLTEELYQTVPKTTRELMEHCLQQQAGPVFADAFSLIILSILRRTYPSDLAAILDVTEGLEFKLKATANTATSWEEILTGVKSKRYTRTRLQRILVYCVLNLTKKIIEDFDGAGPLYLRVLAFSKRGQDLLREMKSTATLPIIHRPAEYTSSIHYHPSTTLEQMLQYDILATDLYVLGNPVPRRGGLDYLLGAMRVK